jgi:hypothetical protein
MFDLTWIIKVDEQPGGSRWRVSYWHRNPPAGAPGPSNPIVVVHRDEWTARQWAEKLATSWEMDGDAWEVDEDSL